MFARAALCKLVHQVCHLGVLAHLEGIEGALLLGAEVEYQLFHHQAGYFRSWNRENSMAFVVMWVKSAKVGPF